jgi:hypothetical protein
MQRLGPFSPGHIDPQKHQIGGLRIGKCPMNDPGVGIEISAGQRQQASDQERLLAGKWHGSRLGDRHDEIPLSDGVDRETDRSPGR